MKPCHPAAADASFRARRLPVTALFTGFFTLLITNPAISASTGAGSIEELKLLREETVVTATRHEQPISQAPSEVYVITDEDIRQSGSTDLPTVLRRVPGLEVMQTTGADFNVSVRGDNQLQANKVLVLVDGRSIYVDSQAQVFWKAIPVTLPEIKRIEVVKGPAAAVYGFNAFDGVINIITKSPEEMKGTTVQVGGGEFGTISSAAVHAGTQGKLGYRLSLGEDQNQQWRNRNALAFRSYKFNAQTTYALPGESKLSVSGGLVNANRFDGPVTDVTITATQLTQGHAYVAYDRPGGFLRAWWMGTNTPFTPVTDPSLANFLQITTLSGDPRFTAHTNTYNLEGQQTVQIGKTNSFTYGLNYRLNTLSGSFVTGFHQENRMGIYIQDEWRMTQRVTAVAGVRYDLDTFIHAQFSPRLALLYKPDQNHTFRIGLSAGYRPPTLAERWLNIQSLATIPTLGGPVVFMSPTIGSANLNPEEIVSYNLGYQGWYFRHRLRVRADLFYNHLSNLINFISTGSAPTAPVIAMNGPNADIYGGEAGVEFLATRWLTGFANYAYQEFGQTFTGFNQRGMPRYKVNAGLRGEWENGLSSEVAVYHVGAATYPIGSAFSSFAPFGVISPNQRVGSYNLLNLRLGYKFWHEQAEVALSAFNALNDRHKEHPLGDTIGSRVMGWLTLKF